MKCAPNVGVLKKKNIKCAGSAGKINNSIPYDIYALYNLFLIPDLVFRTDVN